MTLTFNEAYTSVDITDDLITAYVAALPSPDHSLVLTISKNCETDYTFTVTSSLDQLIEGSNKITLTPDDLGDVTDFKDGVWYVKLVKTVTVGGATTESADCVLIDRTIACDLLSYVADNISNDDKIISAVAMYRALSAASLCSDCECNDACTIFNRLSDMFNNELNLTDCDNC